MQFLLGNLPVIGGAILSFFALLGAVFFAGKRKATTDQKLKRADEYAETRRKADEADIIGDDPDLSRRWLRERGKRPGDL